MELMSLYASLSLDTGKFEEGVKGISSKAVALGNLISSGVSKAVSTVTDLGKAAYGAFQDYESGYAKVQSIAGSGFDMSKISAEMMDVSNATAMSIGAVQEAVYGWISATGDVEGAARGVEAAAKLAAAGFADLGSAQSVLNTTMNVYGMTADDAAHISDTLLQVQNKGVTTVGELASVMGQALASAGKYGVSLENVEAGYIALTKAGIDTNQSTTMLKTMMDELGDTGSKTGKLLQEKTGKSFSALVADGASLSDILSVIQESTNGDVDAFNALWGSQVAGSAATAIINQGLDTFALNLEELQGAAGDTEAAYSTMTDTIGFQTAKLKNKAANLMIKMFAPVGEKISVVFGKVNNAIDRLLTAFEAGGMEELIRQFGTEAGKAFDLIKEKVLAIDWAGIARQAADKVAGAFSTLAEVLSGIDWASAAKKAIELLGKAMQGALTIAIDSIKQMLGGAADWLLPLAGAIGGVFAAFKGAQVIGGAVKAVKGFAGGFKALSAAMSANPILLVVGAIAALVAAFVTAYNTNEEFRQKVDEVWGAISGFAQKYFVPVIDFFKNLWSTITGLFTGEASGQEIITGIWEGIKGAGESLWGSITGWFSNIWTTIKGFFAGSELGSGIISGIEAGINAAGDVLARITGFFSTLWGDITGLFTGETTGADIIQHIYDGISGAIDSVGALITGLFETLWNNIGAIFGAETLGSDIINGIKASLDAAADVFDSIIALFSDLWTNIVGLLTGETTGADILNGLYNGLLGVVGSTGELIKAIFSDLWAAIVGFFSAEGLGGQIFQGLLDGLTSASASFGESINQVFSDIWSGILGIFGIASPSTKAKEAGEFIVEGLKEGAESGEKTFGQQIKDVFRSIWDGIVSFFTGGDDGKKATAEDAAKIGEGVVEGISKGMIGGESILTSAETLKNNVLSEIATAFGMSDGGTSATTSEPYGAGIAAGVQAGILSFKFSSFTSLKNAIETGMKTALGITGTVAEKFKLIGKYVAQGLAQGITENTKSIEAAAIQAAQKAYDAAKNKLEIKSPSRVMAEIGRYYDEGFAKGISQNAYLVQRAAGGIAEDAAYYGSHDINVTQNIAAVPMSANELAIQTSMALQMLRFQTV